MKKIKVILLALFALSALAFTAYAQKAGFQDTVEDAANNYNVNDSTYAVNPTFNAFSDEVYNSIYKIGSEGKQGPFRGEYFNFSVFPIRGYNAAVSKNANISAEVHFGANYSDGYFSYDNRFVFFVTGKQNGISREDKLTITRYKNLVWKTTFDLGSSTLEKEVMIKWDYYGRRPRSANWLSGIYRQFRFTKSDGKQITEMLMKSTEDPNSFSCDLTHNDGSISHRPGVIEFDGDWSNILPILNRYFALNEEEKKFFSNDEIDGAVRWKEHRSEIEKIKVYTENMNFESLYFSLADHNEVLKEVTNIFNSMGKVMTGDKAEIKR